MNQEQNSSMPYPPPPPPANMSRQPSGNYYENNNIATNWRNSERDAPKRTEIVGYICRILRDKRPGMTSEFEKKIVQMAQRLEDDLYRSSSSMAEYSNITTLKARLQAIAQQKHQKHGQNAPSGHTGPPHTTAAPQDGYHDPNARNYPSNPGNTSNRPQYRPSGSNLPAPTGGWNNDGVAAMPAPPPPPNPQWSGHHTSNTTAQPPPPPPPSAEYNLQRAASQGSNMSRNPQPPSGEKPNSQSITRLQQERLYRLISMIQHANTCGIKIPQSKCTMPPQKCESLKRFSAHIAKCKDPECKMDHCISSRRLMSHFRDCKNGSACPVCGPVRRSLQHSRNTRAPPPPGQAPPAQQQQQQQQPTAALQQSQQSSLAQRQIEQLREEKKRAEEEMKLNSQRAKMLEQKVAALQRQSSSVMGAASMAPAAVAPPPPPPPAAATITAAASGEPKQKRGPRAGGTARAPKAEKKTPVSAKRTKADTASMVHAPQGTPAAPIHRPVKSEVSPVEQSSVSRDLSALEQRQRDILKLWQNRKKLFNPIVSVLNTMSRSDIEKHIRFLYERSLNPAPSEMKQIMHRLLNMQLELSYTREIFNAPVDPEAMGLYDYFDIISNPMDLGTMNTRVDAGYYRDLTHFASDARLVYDNAILFNPEGTEVNLIAKRNAMHFERDMAETLRRIRNDDRRKRERPNSCVLCADTTYQFEPIVYYCVICDSIIKRNTIYFLTTEQKFVLCQTCHDKPGESLVIGDRAFEKSKLERKTNNEIKEEQMIRCAVCRRLFHHICALYNGRASQYGGLNYGCPFCALQFLENHLVAEFPQPTPEKSDKSEKTDKSDNLRAKNLPTCKLSDMLEERLNQRIKQERESMAKAQGVRVSDTETPGDFTVRVVVHKETEYVTRTNFLKVYEDSHYPKTFPHRVKCILLFQEIDGIDTLVFVLYIQSYGTDAPHPNQRMLYISYLDSVYFITPRYLRTPAYQELLISTIEYEKQRGITKVFIWACPPEVGTDYVLYCHPKSQKNPKDTILKNWYCRLLEDARRRGIVVCVDNLYDSYMRRVCSMMDVPNFDGDFWPSVAEQVITEKLQKKGVNPRDSVVRSTTKRKGTAKKKKKTPTKAIKAALEASGPPIPVEVPLWPPPKPPKWTQLACQDNLLAKLGDRVKPKKDDFMVVYLWHICADCQRSIDQPEALYWLPTEMEYQDAELDPKNKHAPPYALCDACYRRAYEKEYGELPEVQYPPNFNPSESCTAKRSISEAELDEHEASEKKSKTGEHLNNSGETNDGEQDDDEDSAEGEGDSKDEVCGDHVLPQGVHAKSADPWIARPVSLKEMKVLRTQIPRNTSDSDPFIDNQFMDTRNSFLTLCQKNAYQFDELRRAKHSTMMFLFHTQNPDVPQYDPNCQICHKDINESSWYKCETCTDYEVCRSCYQSKGGNPDHEHPLVKSESKQLISREEELKRRQNIEMQLKLLMHSSGCVNDACPAQMCGRMKQYLHHYRECPTRRAGQKCNTCQRLGTLIQLHARNCRIPADKCRVPSCYRVRQHWLQAQAQQQDRRARAQDNRMNGH